MTSSSRKVVVLMQRSMVTTIDWHGTVLTRRPAMPSLQVARRHSCNIRILSGQKLYPNFILSQTSNTIKKKIIFSGVIFNPPKHSLGSCSAFVMLESYKTSGLEKHYTKWKQRGKKRTRTTSSFVCSLFSALSPPRWPDISISLSLFYFYFFMVFRSLVKCFALKSTITINFEINFTLNHTYFGRMQARFS